MSEGRDCPGGPPDSRRGPVRPVLYPLLRLLGRLVLNIFLRDFRVRLDHPVPEEGPVIFASNHPNGMMDPLSVMQVTGRPVHFLARGQLLDVPVQGWLLRRCGVLPVYRTMDDPSRMAGNQGTFDACYELLEAGGAVGIFPEGVSHPESEVKNLKTGAARIALGVEERNGYRLGVRLIPLGLTFPQRARFRSLLGIHVGQPISLEPFYEGYRQDPHKVVREVTRLLEERIKATALHVDLPEHADLVNDIHAVYQKELARDLERSGRTVGPTADPTAVQRGIAQAVRYYHEHDPEVLEGIRLRLNRYVTRLRRVRIRDDALGAFRSRGRSVARELALGLAGLAGLPIALYGTVNNFIPWLLARTLGPKIEESPPPSAQGKVLIGLAAFPLFYGGQTAAVGWALGGLPAVIYALSLPVLGLFAVRFWRKARAAGRRGRAACLAFRRPALVARLKADRQELLDEFQRLCVRFLQARGETPPGAS